MNFKTIGGLIVLVILLAVGWYAFQLQQQTAKWKNAKEIVEESFNKDGAVATIHYVGVIDGPIDKVQDAVWNVEGVSTMVENFKKSDLVKQEGNSKTVLMQLQALNLPLQQYTMEFTLDAPSHRVNFKTIQSQAADLVGSYTLEPSPDGKKTRMTYDVKSTDKIAVPFPAAVIESANREVFVNTVRGVEKSIKGQPPRRPAELTAPHPPRRAEFVAGAARIDRLPPPALPEIAFAGRSNVGKSALLNRLLGRRGLARVSKTPGRTQQINFFAVDARLVVVDLPGYGFARVPLAVKEQWRRLVEGYLTRRQTLRAVVLLVDVRRGVEPDDAGLLDFLAAHGVPAVLVVTKIDKLARGPRLRRLAEIAAQRPGDALIGFSAVSGDGVAELWSAVNRLIGG